MITLKRAKLLSESNPDILFFLGAATSGSSGWSMGVPVKIESVVEWAKVAEAEDYVLNIYPFFPEEHSKMEKQDD